ncbi:MAG: GtrA family protein [Saprospiraceae bacterium]|nr:GtrA family protein [Saprospiraceae bacterium]
MKLVSKIVKFSSVGLIVSLITLGASMYALGVLKTPLIPTYVFIYGTSILVSYFLNSRYTFKSSVSGTKTIIYFTIYLLSMCTGVILLNIYSRLFDVENWIYPFMVVPFTASLNFILSNKYLKTDG